MASAAAGTWFNMKVLVRAMLLIALCTSATAARPARRSAMDYLFGDSANGNPSSLARRFMSEFYWGGQLITQPVARSAYELPETDGPEAVPTTTSGQTPAAAGPSYGSYTPSPAPIYSSPPPYGGYGTY